MTKAASRLMEAAQEMRQIARGEVAPADLYRPLDVDVKALRARLRLSVDEFAAEFSFAADQVRDWERGLSRPLDSQRAYLSLIDAHPEFVRKALAEFRTTASSGV